VQLMHGCISYLHPALHSGSSSRRGFSMYCRDAQRRYGYKPWNGRPPNQQQDEPLDDRQGKKKKKGSPTAASGPSPVPLNRAPLPLLTSHDDPDGIGPIWQELGLFLKVTSPLWCFPPPCVPLVHTSKSNAQPNSGGWRWAGSHTCIGEDLRSS
jgi:hypothetical protein